MTALERAKDLVEAVPLPSGLFAVGGKLLGILQLHSLPRWGDAKGWADYLAKRLAKELEAWALEAVWLDYPAAPLSKDRLAAIRIQAEADRYAREHPERLCLDETLVDPEGMLEDLLAAFDAQSLLLGKFIRDEVEWQEPYDAGRRVGAQEMREAVIEVCRSHYARHRPPSSVTLGAAIRSIPLPGDVNVDEPQPQTQTG
jgi:hypothetical protein